MKSLKRYENGVGILACAMAFAVAMQDMPQIAPFLSLMAIVFTAWGTVSLALAFLNRHQEPQNG